MEAAFHLGRQPIINRHGELVAYELLFRSSHQNQANVTDDFLATAHVIQNAFSQIGLDQVLGEHLGFINIDASLMMSDVLELLPKKQTVLEILETVDITPEIIKRCIELRQKGFLLALDDIIEITPQHKEILPHIQYVKLDLLAATPEQINRAVHELKRHPVKLLAEKIDSQEQHEHCKRLGFDLFQGYFFAKPTILTGQKPTPSQAALLRLLGLVHSDAETDQIEAAFKHAPELTVNLLKLVNSVASGVACKIDSVARAITVLGRRQLGRWIQLLVYTQQSGHLGAADPLSQTAAIRGKLMELAARHRYPQDRTIAENRRGLELIVRAVPGLMEHHAIGSFGEGVLTQFAALLKIPPDGIVCALHGSPLDENDKESLFVVGATGRLTNYIAEPLDKISSAQIVHAITDCLHKREHIFGDNFTVLLLKGGNQEAAIYLETNTPISTNDRQLVEVFAANITACFANVKYVEKLNFVAYHDTLTHLGNRSQFILQLETAMKISPQTSHVVALIDLDHFADINDGLGQEVGNSLLMAVAARLMMQLGKDCQLARIANDVFGVLGPEKLVNPSSLQSLFEQTFSVGEHQLPVTVTIGLSAIKTTAGGGYTLLKHASIALNRAKRDVGANYAYFEGEMEDDTRWRLEIVRHLRQDFIAEKLVVWFQPQISLVTSKVSGIEALLRWPSDTGFVQPPSVFIPLAEYSGLIVEIGDWVLQQSADAYRTLLHLPNRPEHISVNVSMPQFKGGKLPERVATIMGERMIPPSALELEITESIALDQPRLVISQLRELRELGVRVAIDDFGTGYSSLGQLKALPIDCLKIDQSFIAEISSGRGGMFAETIVALGNKLGLSTVAEGVETAEQAGFLRGLGCSDAQGYYYAHPMPLADLVKWLEARQAK